MSRTDNAGGPIPLGSVRLAGTAVRVLRVRGVVFEEYDLPGLKTVEGVAEIVGNYPGKGGKGELSAWFKDSEGNLIGVGQPLR